MFQRVMDGIRASTGSTVRLTTLALAAAIALFITTSFLCAAVFIQVLQTYGPVQACLAGAGVFFLLTLAAAGSYLAYKKELEKRADRAAKSAAQNLLADPMLIATGLQIVRAIGVKRLLPILAIGGVALGILASRAGAAEDTSAEAAE
jgi:Zn-dependent protease with chaperone function